ncbi:MAG: hypothetical protein IPI67_39605 [Myxococcales bacterium]|nr:hypothetical protein [Myxococcales bacterium]
MGDGTTQAPARQGVLAWALLALLLGTAAGGLWSYGRGFYTLGVEARVDHEAFRVLGPGEVVGHGYGIVGTALILTNLFYVVRRRFPSLPIGSMRAWLNLHTTTGLFGGLLVLYHSAFQFRSPIATVTIWALSLVIATGLLGRIIHGFTRAPDLAELEPHLAVFDGIRPGISHEIRGKLKAIERVDLEGRSLVAVLVTLPKWRREAFQRRAAIEQTLAAYDHLHRAEFQLLGTNVRAAKALLFGEVRARAAGNVLRGWRSIHRLAAVIMVLLVTVHIGVAWQYGYRWIFSDAPALVP